MKNVWIIIKYIQVHSFRVKLMNRAGQGSGYTDPLYYILSLPLLGNLNNPPPQKKKKIYIYKKACPTTFFDHELLGLFIKYSLQSHFNYKSMKLVITL